jgi:hypothetical protein
MEAVTAIEPLRRTSSGIAARSRTKAVSRFARQASDQSLSVVSAIVAKPWPRHWPPRRRGRRTVRLRAQRLTGPEPDRLHHRRRPRRLHTQVLPRLPPPIDGGGFCVSMLHQLLRLASHIEIVRFDRSPNIWGSRTALSNFVMVDACLRDLSRGKRNPLVDAHEVGPDVAADRP